MNARSILAASVLVPFMALSGWAVAVHGYVGIFEAELVSLATIQVLADLTIALSLVSIWLFKDARDRGLSPWPYLALTATLGSIGPLLYLILRERESVVAFEPATR